MKKGLGFGRKKVKMAKPTVKSKKPVLKKPKKPKKGMSY